jgi:hypothetical protein
MTSMAAGMASPWHHLAPVHLLPRRPLREKKAPQWLILVPIWCQKTAPFRAFCCFPLPLVANQQKARERCIHADSRAFKSGDPNGIRTRVTAVKGRMTTEMICLGANLVPTFGHYEEERMAPD